MRYYDSIWPVYHSAWVCSFFPKRQFSHPLLLHASFVCERASKCLYLWSSALQIEIVWLTEEHSGVDLCRECSCCFLRGRWLFACCYYPRSASPSAGSVLSCVSDLLNWVAEKQVSWGQRLWRRSLCWLFPDTWSYTTSEAVITKIWPRNSKPGDT